MSKTKLHLLPFHQYGGVNREDPLRFYYWPVIGGLYRQRLEQCLDECSGGKRILEVGFGTGVSFLNLKNIYLEIHGIDLTADIERVKLTFAGMELPLHLRKGDVKHIDYPNDYFDTVLLVSILEHLRPSEQKAAFMEIARVLKPGGQAIVGIPVERPFMAGMFRLMGVDIREHHFSTEVEIVNAAENFLLQLRQQPMRVPIIGEIYRVVHFVKK